MQDEIDASGLFEVKKIPASVIEHLQTAGIRCIKKPLGFPKGSFPYFKRLIEISLEFDAPCFGDLQGF